MSSYSDQIDADTYAAEFTGLKHCMCPNNGGGDCGWCEARDMYLNADDEDKEVLWDSLRHAEDDLDELSDYYEGAPDYYEEEDYYEFPDNWEED